MSTNMSLRFRMYGSGVASWIAFAAVFLIQDVRVALTVVAPLFILGSYLAFTARCPHCGEPVYRRRRRFFGETWTYWSHSPQRICSSCNREILGPPLPPSSDGEVSPSRTSIAVSSYRKNAIRFASMAAASFLGTWFAYMDGTTVIFQLGAGVTVLWLLLSVYFSRLAGRAGGHQAS